jgi:hypothetical protein
VNECRSWRQTARLRYWRRLFLRGEESILRNPITLKDI